MKLFSQMPKPTFLPTLRSVPVAVAALLLCLVSLAQPASAETVISTNTTISSSITDQVSVVASPTGSPTVNLSGGYIAYNLRIFDSSTVNVSSGNIGRGLYANDSSTVNLSGGGVGYDLHADGASTVNLSGSFISGYLYANSTVNMSGGYVGLDLYIGGTVNLSGGSMRGNLYIDYRGTLNVYGTGLSLSPPSADAYGTYYTLTGTLQDGTGINKPVYLGDYAEITQVHLHNPDPLVVLQAQVQTLKDAGTLSSGNTNALLVKLTAAQAAAAAGDTAGERDALTGFINQVKAFVRTGKLTAAQGTALTAAALAILDGLG